MPSVAEKRKRNHDEGDAPESSSKARSRQEAASVSKRVRDAENVAADEEDDEHVQNGTALTTHDLTAQQASASLQTTSYDALRQALLNLRSATSIRHHDERLAASDRRIQLAKDLMGLGALGGGADKSVAPPRGLFDAWNLADSQQQLAILPLPLFVLANLITLLGAHQPDHELGEEIIAELLPKASNSQGDVDMTAKSTSSGAGKYWQRLQEYLTSADSLTSTSGTPASAAGSVKGKAVQRSSRDVEVLTLATLRLLLAMTSFAGARHARTVFDATLWSRKSLARLATKRRRVFVNKRDRKAMAGRPNPQVTLDRPDIRTLWVLLMLSFLRTPSGSCTPANLRIAALNLGKDYYPAIIKGLSQDPAPIVAHILLGFHDGILSDEAASKLPRSSTVSLFNEWGCKDLLALYDREGDLLHINGVEDSHSIADVAHHFLLALCTHPGRGVCYVDNGWYGRSNEDDNDVLDEADDKISEKLSIFNKISYGILRSLSPSKSPKQNELALRILGASSELVGLQLANQVQLEPRAASLSWLSTATFIGRIFSLPLPDFQRASGQWMSKPPSLKTCLDNLAPAVLTRSVLTRAVTHSDRLTRLAGLTLLLQYLKRLEAFKTVCLQASGEALSTEDSQSFISQLESADALPLEDDVLCGGFGFEAGAKHPWLARWTEVMAVAKERLPEVGVLLDSIASATVVQDRAVNGQQNGTSNRPRDEASLRELALRAAWQETELLGDEMDDLAPNALDRVIKAAIGDAAGADKPLQDETSLYLGLLSRLHALQIISVLLKMPSRPLDPFVRVSGSSQTYVWHLLQLQTQHSRKAAPVLQPIVKKILKIAMAGSPLFEQNTDEWQAWEFALQGANESLVTFFDECLQRCLKTPYRYLEFGRRLTDSDVATGVSSLPSLLLFTMLEQWCIRMKKGLLEDEMTQPLQAGFTLFLGDLLPSISVLGLGSPEATTAIINEVQEAFKASATASSQDVSFALDVMRAKVQAIFGPEVSSGASKNVAQADRKKDSRPRRPFNNSQLRAILSDTATSALTLSSLHPSEECLVTVLQEGESLPHRVAAFHCAFSVEGCDRVDWNEATLLEAKLLFAAMKRNFLTTGDPQQVSNVCLRAFEHGLLDESYIGGQFLGDSAVLAICNTSKNALECITDIAVEIFSTKKSRDAQDCLEQLWMVAERSAPYLCSKLIRLLPVEERARYLGTTLQQPQAETALVCEAITSSSLSSLNLQDVAKLVQKLGISETTATEQILHLLSDVSLEVEDDEDHQSLKAARTVVDFVCSAHAKGGIRADAALYALLAAMPHISRQALTSMVKAQVLMPFSADRAVRVVLSADARAADIPVKALIEMAMSGLFSSGATHVLASLVRQLTVVEEDLVLRAFADAMPEKPASAFRPVALSFAASIAGLDKVRPLLKRLSEKALLHLVRRFAEDAEDSNETIEGVAAFTALLSIVPGLCDQQGYLVEPVLTAALKNRIDSQVHVALIRRLLPSVGLQKPYRQSCLDTLLRSQVSSLDHTMMDEMVACVHASALADIAVISESIARSLTRFYGATLALRDRRILHTLHLYEQTTGTSILDLLSTWTPPTGEGTTASLDDSLANSHTLLRLDASRIHDTCLRFPRGRGFSDLIRSGYEDVDHQDTVESSVYDPVLVLACVSAVLADEQFLAVSQCIELLRSNCIGLLACSMSSKHPEVRDMGAILLARVYGAMQRADVFEKDQLLVVLDGIRNAYTRKKPNEHGELEPLPLATTLFAAHALRALCNPSLYVYPPISHFLLQRAAPLDPSDIPLLYSFLYSSSLQSSAHRQERLFILRFVTACMRFGGSTDWRIMKRRHVWPAVCSLYTATSDIALQRAVEQFWLAAAQKSQVAMSVVLRQGFLIFVQQQTLAMRAEGRMAPRDVDYWLQLVHALVSSLNAESMFQASGLSWVISVLDILQQIAGDEQTELSDVSKENLNETLDTLSSALDAQSSAKLSIGTHHASLLPSLRAAARRSNGNDNVGG